VDLIPLDNDPSLYAIEDGFVLRDNDVPRYGGAYGNFIVIWNAQKKRAWWYCHLASNYVFYGQRVSKNQKIGVMGSTGNSSGPHLHLGLRYSDSNANAVNLGNGYQGYVDPLQVLIDMHQNQNTSNNNNQTDNNNNSSTHPYNTDNNTYSDQNNNYHNNDSSNSHPYNTSQNSYKKHNKKKSGNHSHPYNTDQNSYRR
jgi:hypothetical protein